jgi:hypothetical protein
MRGLKQGAQGDNSAQILIDSVLQYYGLVLGDGVELPDSNPVFPLGNEQRGTDGKGHADCGRDQHRQKMLGRVPQLPAEHFLCSRRGNGFQVKYVFKVKDAHVLEVTT